MVAPLVLFLPLMVAGAVAVVRKRKTRARSASALDYGMYDQYVREGMDKKATERLYVPPRAIETPRAVSRVTCPPTASNKTAVVVPTIETSRQPCLADQKEDVARAAAPGLDALLKKNVHADQYLTNDPDLVRAVKDFQEAAGLTADGCYGPSAAGALMYYLGGQPPPPPWFFSADEGQHIKIFRPQ